MSLPPKKLDALTGLRFVAAAMIVVWHASMFGVAIPDFAWYQGVSFFFVLSGFILFYVHPRLATPAAAGQFLWDRIARIWPAHVALLLAVVVVLRIPVENVFLLNLLLLQAWVPVAHSFFSYNFVSWSISTELAFYFAFPLLIQDWRRTFWWKLLVAAVLLATAILITDGCHLPTDYSASEADQVSGYGLVYISPLGRLLEFTIGIACCSVFRWAWPRLPASFWLSTVLEFAACGCFAFSAGDWANVHIGPLLTPGAQIWLVYSGSTPACALIVVVFAFGRGLLSRIAASAPAVLLGEISFSVYLLHTFVNRVWLRSLPGGLGSAVACAGITLIGAYLLWRLVELPARRRLRLVPGLFARTRSPARGAG